MLPEVEGDSLGDVMLDFPLDRDREEVFVDFEETFSISNTILPGQLDIFAFSNYGAVNINLAWRRGRLV